MPHSLNTLWSLLRTTKGVHLSVPPIVLPVIYSFICGVSCTSFLIEQPEGYLILSTFHFGISLVTCNELWCHFFHFIIGQFLTGWRGRLICLKAIKMFCFTPVLCTPVKPHRNSSVLLKRASLYQKWCSLVTFCIIKRPKISFLSNLAIAETTCCNKMSA